MDLIEDDPLDFSDDFTAAINHVSEDFGGHDEASCVLVDGDVTGDQTDI